MLALVCICVVMVLLLSVLVVGLLRSHADILRALHSLGAGIGDPSDHAASGRQAGEELRSAPVVLGPRLPPERDSGTISDIEGTTPDGDALAISVTGADHLTLLVFLTSGCSSCAAFWKAFEAPDELGLPAGLRPVIVTKGPELERPVQLQARNVAVPVVMSTAAWESYEVPGSPFFVLADGPGARRIGEGTAGRLEQVVSMIEQAIEELGGSAPGSASGSLSRAAARRGAARLSFDLTDRERERRNDRELLAAGIYPGHESLYRPLAPEPPKESSP